MGLKGGAVVEVPLKDLTPTVSYSLGNCLIILGVKQSWIFIPHAECSQASRLADAFFELRQARLRFGSPEDDARFQEVARNYLAAKPKPQLPEAARRFKVQAEGAISDKEFSSAADYYQQALEIALWWPNGHYNRALVLSESDDYLDAIVEMRRYLLLAPNAPDARAAQDKIYDWERKTSSAK